MPREEPSRGFTRLIWTIPGYSINAPSLLLPYVLLPWAGSLVPTKTCSVGRCLKHSWTSLEG